MAQAFKVGTRTSPLALRQTEEVKSALRKCYPYLKLEIVGIDTFGDRNKDIAISQIEGTDFFTREIDDALLRGEIDGSTSSFGKLRTSPERSRGTLTINPERSRRIDFAVHSAKDLADNLRQGLAIAALTNSIDPYDALVSKHGLKLDQLPYRAKIGTSSLRRKQQLKEYRNDFKIVDIRGNIQERLDKLDKSDLDAIVIAAAGLIRLGLENKITQRIPLEILSPHPLQGALAVVTREEDLQLIDLLSVLDSRKAILA